MGKISFTIVEKLLRSKNNKAPPINGGVFYNNIGLICSPFKANSIVLIIYSASNTIDLGLVIGLSCLKGTK